MATRAGRPERPSIVSLLYVLENGSSAEIAVVGHEGIVGISLFMGGETTPSRSVVQSAGQGREGVTDAAANLQRAGLIRHRRGHITVLDREGLERRTCECYAVVKREYDRLLPVGTAH
jgi:Crp-like helix-turn-helix domain